MRNLTSGDPSDDVYPIWSPNSKDIVYSSSRPSTKGRYAIYSIPAAGGKERKLSNQAGGAGEPAFSPDGTELAFIGHGVSFLRHVAALRDAERRRPEQARPDAVRPHRLACLVAGRDADRLHAHPEVDRSRRRLPRRSRRLERRPPDQGPGRQRDTARSGRRTARRSPSRGSPATPPAARPTSTSWKTNGDGMTRLTFSKGQNGGPVWQPTG